ncbi:MAG: tRNA (guanine(26)-N(2))-dimethyltransferase [Candidatus Nanoarchaeia archaeon]
MSQIITEASSKIYGEIQKVVSADMEVFYNPVMRVNRDFTLLVLAASEKKDMKIADALAGSGIRSLRLIKELPSEKIKQILVNDAKKDYEDYMQKNIELNELSEQQKSKILPFNNDARKFLMNNRPFDYIDIDPFGTPNPFLDSAIQAIRNKGILSVTATDTSALCGSYVSACKRKYWASPLRNEWMHEFGLRILARKVQLLGIQYDKALIPVFSYAKDHYMKIFFRCDQGKTKVDKVLEAHKTVAFKGKEYGPVWIGQLWDSELVEGMMKESEKLEISKETKKILAIINEEKNVDSVFFHDAHKLSEKLKTGDTPKFEKLIDSLKKKGFKASRTHFSVTGIKTNASEEEFRNVFEEEMKK